MSKEQTPQMPTLQKVFPATVVAVNDSYTVAINRGSAHGIKIGQRFLVYGLSDDEIVDPETGDSLGRLEIVRGTGVVTHLQERLATIETDKRSKSKRTITHKPQRRYPLAIYLDDLSEKVETIDGEERYVAFEDPRDGDKARPI